MKPEVLPRIQRIIADGPAAETAKLLRQIEQELEFAAAFSRIADQSKAEGWDDLIGRASALVEEFDPATGIMALRDVVRAAEKIMEPIGTAAKEYTIHCVGHGHIDMNWMWSWPETVAQTHDTFASVLSFMEQYPDVTYSQSQASVYALIERYYPAMFEQIKRRVAEGRWEIAAVHWVEGDKNISSAESLCRHLLYTRKFMKERFGKEPEDLPMDWEPDTFGHAVTVPAIDSQGAVKFYYCCRPGGGMGHARIGDERPALFYWEAPSGERILVNREITWYNTFGAFDDSPAIPMVNFAKETGLHEWLNMYGIGNHGGGPTREQIEYFKRTQTWPIYPKVIFSTALTYFKAIEREIEASRKASKLPVIKHELNFEFTGCYTTQTLIKRGNRFGENYLVEAETLAAIGSLLYGMSYPSDRLREAWINVLFGQFHDILPGSGIRETREHAQALFQEVGAITGSIKRLVMSAFAKGIDTLALLPHTPTADDERALVEKQVANTPFVAGAGIGSRQSGYSAGSGGGRRFLPYVVYNPTAWTRSERVVCKLYDPEMDPARLVAVDESGHAQPVVLLEKGNDWGHDFLEVAFNAADVPGLGYRTYVFQEGAPDEVSATVSESVGNWYETPDLKFRVDRWQSGIAELIDKRTGAVLAGHGAPLGAWQLVKEQPQGMSAWVLGEEVDAPIALKALSVQSIGGGTAVGTGNPSGAGAVGYEVRADLEVPGTKSKVNLRTVISALEPRIDFIADVDWREIGDDRTGIPGLVISFPLPLTDIVSTYEIPFGSIERKLFNREEVPALRWANIAGKAITETGARVDADVTLVQDCRYGHSIDGTNLRLRIIRSSYDPDHAPEVCRQVVRYSLIFGDGTTTPAARTRLGAAFNHPFIVTPTTLHGGSAPARRGLANVKSGNAVLSSLKMAEDGSGVIVRLSELNGKAGEVALEFDDAFASRFTRAEIVDTLERPTGETARISDGALFVKAPAYGFVSVKLS